MTKKKKIKSYEEQALWAELKGNENAIICLEEQNGKIRSKIQRIENKKPSFGV